MKKLIAFLAAVGLVLSLALTPTLAAPPNSGTTPTPCNVVQVSVASATTTTLVTATAGQTIWVCGYVLFSNGTDNVTLEYGTNAQCTGSPTAFAGPYDFLSQSGIAKPGPVIALPVGVNLCVVTSANPQLGGEVDYFITP